MFFEYFSYNENMENLNVDLKDENFQKLGIFIFSTK